MFSGQCFAILTMFVERLHDFFQVDRLRDFFLLRGCVVLCVERLHDFVCRGCMIILTHSLTHHSGCMIFFSGGGVIYFVERLHDFFVERLCDFFV